MEYLMNSKGLKWLDNFGAMNIEYFQKMMLKIVQIGIFLMN